MTKIRINNIEVETGSDQTILDAARKAGISIPTLCHKDGVEHYSSCMVCMVKENKTNNFIPSCTALAQEGMDIDASGEEVLSIRKKAIELLLSEHRAECEAQCRVVCPAGYNIPLMNRLLADGDIERAIMLSFSEVNSNEIKCLTCAGYCENACRRKKIDTPVSIRNIMIFIAQSTAGDYSAKISNLQANKDLSDSLARENHPFNKKQFSSRIGRLETSEQNEWLKECTGDGTRYRTITDFRTAGAEAENCMHCDCRAAGNCTLRELAEEYTIKDPKGKLVNAPVEKKINHRNGLIFENAKCIKCGLCVRLCEDSTDEPALCFINRGFVSIISEPLTEEFDNILAAKADICIEICPTGALSRFK